MSRRSRVLAAAGALLLVVLVLGTLGSHSGSRGALRTYLAELNAKGEKLTYAELMRGRLTTFFDSHAVITNAAASLRGGKLSPGLLEPRQYVGPGEAVVMWRLPSPIWGKSSVRPTQGTWEELAAQMEAAQDSLQDARDALKTPAPDAGPYTNLHTTRRVDFVAIRTVAQWLMGATENELHQGHLEAALQDIEALAGLANMERNEPTLVAQMIRTAVAGLGWSLTWEALEAQGWSEPQLERLQKAWEPVNLVDAVERGFEGARASGYELFILTRHSESAHVGRLLRGNGSLGVYPPNARLADMMMDYVYLPAYKLTSIDQDELFYLRNMQEGITGLRLLKAQHPWAETRQRLNRITSNVNALARSPQKVRYYYSMIAIPNYMKACQAAVHGETERQMTLAAIALKRFQLRQGQFPSSLEALVPEFLAAVPYDFMGARPLSYRVKVDGSYVLYSVGEDGTDDGGDPTPSGGPGGLWTGRDAVWPSAASVLSQ